MGGLLVLVLIGLYVWVAYKVARRVKLAWAKALVVLVALLIPTADAVYGRVKLKQICEAEAGLKIYKAVTGVEGFEMTGFLPKDFWLKEFGYKFVEGRNFDGSLARLSLDDKGNVVEDKNPFRKSKYRYDQESVQTTVAHIVLSHYFVRDINTNETLGVYNNFVFLGGWVERAMAALYGQAGFSATRCPVDRADVQVEKLVTSVLRTK
jgi:hypothetical protein